MTGKDFLRWIANGGKEILGLVLKLLEAPSAARCAVGGPAVNACAEPAAGIDPDIAAATPAIEDVPMGKPWACADAARRVGERQKDLADITRLLEAEPSLRPKLPDEARKPPIRCFPPDACGLVGAPVP